MARILIKGGRVWNGEKFLYSDVLSCDDKILKIEENISEPADMVFDARGKTVTAGLVDAHVHMRGISSDRYGIQGEMSCFPFGVTAAADAGGGYGDKSLLDSFMLKSAVFVSVEIRNNKADIADAMTRLRAYGDRAVGLKVYFDYTVSEVSDITPLKKICDAAHARGLRVMVHSSNSPVKMADILDTLGSGDILTHAFHGGENNASDDNFESMMAAQDRGVIIDVGFAGHVHTDFGVLGQAIKAGVVPDLISTDITKLSAYVRGGRYGMTMCMSMARALGLPEENIFSAVTSNPAAALGREKEWGHLREGGAADIAVLEYADEDFDLTDKSGNRLCGSEGYRCVLTLSDGQVVYRR